MAVIIEDKSKILILLDCSANPNYPASTINYEYDITVAGKIGGASGINVWPGDLVRCIKNNNGGDQATVGSYFIIEDNNSYASETEPGNVRRATTLEVTLGLDDTAYVSPLKLADKLVTLNPLTTKGDLYTFDTANQRLGVGADGYVLIANSSELTGLSWNAPTWLELTGGTVSGTIYSDGGIDVTSTVGTDVLNIGTTNADVINIGSSGATVNILGWRVFEYSANAYITDKLITLNKMFTNLPNELQLEISKHSPIFRSISKNLYENYDAKKEYVNKYCNKNITRFEAQNYIDKYKPLNFVVFFMTKDTYAQNQFNIYNYKKYNDIYVIYPIELLYNKIDQNTFNIQIEYHHYFTDTKLPLYDHLIFDITTTENIFSLRIDCNNLINMIKGNFIGAAIVAIIYTVYILWHPLPEKWQMVLALVVLNALTIVLTAFAFR